MKKVFGLQLFWWENLIILLEALFITTDVLGGRYSWATFDFFFVMWILLYAIIRQDRDEWVALAERGHAALKMLREKVEIAELENYILTAKAHGSTYLLITKRDIETGVSEEGIWCLNCHKTSWNPTDVEKKYCPECKIFHKPIKPIKKVAEKTTTKNETSSTRTKKEKADKGKTRSIA